MSTKYQRPIGAYTGASGLSNRSKYQDDASAEPQVPISSSKMDGDFNYVIDAINTMDDASGSRASIAERLSVALNEDGTLKLSVAGALDDWIEHAAGGLARVDDNTIPLSGDMTGLYPTGRRVRLTVSGATRYASVLSSSESGGTTTVTLADIVDSTGAASTIGATPSEIAYAPLNTGNTGNTAQIFANLRLRSDGGVLRLSDSGMSGREYGLRSNGGNLEIVENTGTEALPTWTVRTTISSSGISIGADAVGLTQLAPGTADKYLGFNAAGEPAELDPVPAGSVVSASFDEDIIQNLAATSNLQDSDLLMIGDLTNGFAPRKISVSTAKNYLAPAATTSAAGSVELATSAEVAAETAGKVPTTDSLRAHPAFPKVVLGYNHNANSVTYNHGVASVTDNGTGDFTITFDTAFADTDYVYVVSAPRSGLGSSSFTYGEVSKTTSALRLQMNNQAGTAEDFFVCVTIYGNQ